MNEEKKINNFENIDLTITKPISIQNSKKENDIKEKGKKSIFSNFKNSNKINSNLSNNNSNLEFPKKPENHLLNLNFLPIENNKINNPSLHLSEVDSKEQKENYTNLESIIELPNKNNDNLLSKKNSNSKENEIYNNIENHNQLNISNEDLTFERNFIPNLSRIGKTSKIKLHEFYINNNIKNKELKHKNNKINTTKYNLFTFLPKSLLIQFGRLPNVYFLSTAIIQSIPIISPLSSITAIVPLIFVLAVSMIRELIEDLSRLKYDNLNNNEEVIVYRDNKFIKANSSSIQLGELIIVLENKQIPSDMILIDSNLNDGMSFVETSSLDGEKNLKPKIANSNLCGILNNLLNSPEEKPFNCNIFYGMEIEGFCQCDPPNSDLHKLDGTISVKYNINNFVYKSKFAISERQMLLKGSILKNTNWIAGFVLYTGMNNKIILNSKRPRTKISLIEKKMNEYLIGIFFLLIILCIICSILHAKKYNENKGYYEIFIILGRSNKLESFITFFTYFLLLNTLIPISLIITIEIVKIIQGFFISWDAEMYSSIRHKFAKAKTVSINEELGNVNYIFSDKTGTLTSNKMIFKYCIIQGKCYEYDRNSYKRALDVLKDSEKNVVNNETLKSKKKFPIIKFPRNYFSDILRKEPKRNLSNGTSKTQYIKNKNEDKEINIINEFWTAISIAHECVCTKIGEYSGVSPDDVELVKTAHEQGYTFMQSSNKLREIRIGDLIQTFDVLNVLNFSSERKRMSIIIKDKNGIIKLYCKGADSEIMKRMSKTSKDNIYSNFTIKCVDKLSCKGYRSLLFAYKIIREEDYIKWNNELKNSEMNLAKKGKLVDKCYDQIEQELELIGATIVEDKLQDLVPETIKDLRMSGIKIWVLTGDKVDTAENIALSCNLISKNQKIFRIYLGQSETERSNNKKTPEIEKFFKEFNDFKKKNRIRNSIISNIKYSQDSSHLNSNPNSINNKSISNLKILNQENKNIIGNNNKNSKCLNPNSIISYNNLLNKSNSISQSIDQLFPQIKSTANIIPSSLKILEPPPFSIIIESPLLTLIFSNKKETNSFLKIASKASSVICCRVSPLQKSLVVQEVKNYDKKAITLAIGDGGNDVSMIMEAHLGIGIYGEEGMRAVQASDFAIGEFKFLRRLLFFHGRINNNRISKMILYFFYKNFVFSIVQFVYAFFCIGSGQTLIDDWFITCYNLIFTALPLGVQAVSDFDLLESDHDIVIQFMPLLYIENRDIHPIFSLHKFVFNLSKGFIYSFLIFYIVCFCDVGSEINEDGDYSTLWYMSLKTYTSIIISVNLTLFLNMRYITFLFTLTMGITSFLLYIIFIIIVQYITMFNSCASIFHSLRTVKFYLCVFLVCSMSFLSDYMRESININFGGKISTNLLKYILDVDSQDNFMEGFVRTRKKYSETLQINYLQKKAMSKLSVFSNNSKNSKNENILDLDNSNDETFKKAKSSELKFNYSKEKMNDHKNFYETMFEGKFKSNESSVLEDEKKGVFFKPNEKWINASKIKLDNDNKILEIPHFQLNTHI